MHPLAVKHNRPTGAFGMKSGDRVFHEPDERIGVADEFLSDGEALMTWDDGSFGIVLWNNLRPLVGDEISGCADDQTYSVKRKR